MSTVSSRMANAEANSSKPSEVRERVVVRFAGDSGDGMQLAGTQFTNASAVLGNEVSTFPDFPAEIRAPAGTLAGVSGFQINIGSEAIRTPGDQIDALVAMNPAALMVCLADLAKGGMLIVNTDEFTTQNLEKAGCETNPLETDLLDAYRVYKVPITSQTVEAVRDSGLSAKVAQRCKNFYALGLVCWLYDRPLDVTLWAWAEGYAYGRAALLVPEEGTDEHVSFRLEQAGSVSGIVLDATSGRPVPGVTVDVPDRTPLDRMHEQGMLIFSQTKCETGKDGRFLVEHVSAGEHVLMAWHTEYPRASKPVEVRAAQCTQDVQVFLKKGSATVWGYVLHGDEPAKGAVVSVSATPKQREVVADTEGYYELTDLAPARYFVHAEMAHGGVEVRDGAAVELDANETTRVDFALTKGAACVEGIVLHDGVPAASVKVSLAPRMNERTVDGSSVHGASPARSHHE